MLTIEGSDLTEQEVHTFVAFASDMYGEVPEMRTGWPRTIATNIGNRQAFVAKSKKVDCEGDILYVRYVQAAGCVQLIVYND